MILDAAREAERRKQALRDKAASIAGLEKYQDDPAGFGTDILGERFAPDIVEVMNSVRDNPVTIAKSANATGKCVAFGEEIRLADGRAVPAESLIGQSFDVWSVPESLRELNPRVNRAHAGYNGRVPVVRITTASGRSIVRTVNHPLATAEYSEFEIYPPVVRHRHWKNASAFAPGDIILCSDFFNPLPDMLVWQRRGLPISMYWDIVTAVEHLGEQDTVAIEVERDHTFITDFIEHNTHGAARIAVWFYKVFPGAQVYTTAAPPEDNLRRLLWGEIGKITHAHKKLFNDDGLFVMHITRSPVEFITGVSIPLNDPPEKREARFSGKHAPYLLFIVDEGDAVPPEIYRAIEGCMSGGHARLLVMFNPRARQGPVYRMERDRQAKVIELNAFRHPNVVTGDEVYPGAVTRLVTARRIHDMTRPLNPHEEPDSLCFKVPTYLDGYSATGKDGSEMPALFGDTWRKIVDPAFSYMVMGQYPAQGSNQLISEEWTNNARSRWDAYVAKNGEIPPAGVRAILGQDVAEFGLDSNVGMLRYGGLVMRPRIWSGVDPNETADRIINICQEEDVMAVCIDATGVGAGVPGSVRRRLNRKVAVHGIKVAERATEKAKGPGGEEIGAFQNIRDQLWWSVREWLRNDPGAMLPPDEQLLEELLVPTYDFDNQRRVKIMDKDKMRTILRRSPDRADALCLTFSPINRSFRLDLV